MKNQLETFINRLRKIGIEIELSLNYPWVYLVKVNNNPIKEQFMANHGFTLGFATKKGFFTDITEIFKTIRKYR